MISDWGKRLLGIAAASWLAGCSSVAAVVPGLEDHSLDPQEFTDARTGVTVIGAAEPLVVAHEEPALAVNARDYLSLGIIEVNRMGDYEHYLVVVGWSTIDRGRIRGASDRPAVPEKLTLRVDKRAVKLAAGTEPDPVRDRELYPTPSAASARRYFRVDGTTLRAIVDARRLQIEADRGDEGVAIYFPWGTRGVEALKRFAGRIQD